MVTVGHRVVFYYLPGHSGMQPYGSQLSMGLPPVFQGKPSYPSLLQKAPPPSDFYLSADGAFTDRRGRLSKTWSLEFPFVVYLFTSRRQLFEEHRATLPKGAPLGDYPPSRFHEHTLLFCARNKEAADVASRAYAELSRSKETILYRHVASLSQLDRHERLHLFGPPSE